MSQLYEDKDPLEDKRDEKYIQLKSSTYFYEMFKKKSIKCDDVIPQTILWEAGEEEGGQPNTMPSSFLTLLSLLPLSGNPNMWFFNTSKGKVPSILHKNSEKVNIFEICKFFLGISRPEELRIDNLSTLSEHSKKLS